LRAKRERREEIVKTSQSSKPNNKEQILKAAFQLSKDKIKEIKSKKS
jgi:hypothetical protein